MSVEKCEHDRVASSCIWCDPVGLPTKVDRVTTGETDHGIAAAFFKMAGRYPTLECLCGKEFTSGIWEEAGRLLDKHLDGEGEQPEGEGK